MKLRNQSFFRLAIFMILMALVAASFVLTPRLGLEINNKTVAQAVRYQDCYELINAAGKYTSDVEAYYDTEADLLKRLRRNGINTIVLTDATLERLARTGAVGLEIRDGVAVVSETHSNIFDEVLAGARRRYGDRVGLEGEYPERKMFLRGDTKPVDRYNMHLRRAVQQLPLGIMTHELQKFYKLGFNLIVAPESFDGITERDVEQYFKRLKDAGVPVYAMMSANRSVFGGTDLVNRVASLMERQYLVLQEHYTQLGFFPNKGQLELAQQRNYSVLRAYLIDFREMDKLTYKDALRRWAVADDERHIRLNIILPFLKGDNLIETNLKYVHEISQNVEKRGFKIGLARPFETYFPNRVLLIPVIAGIVAAFMLLCQSILGWGYGSTVVCWGMVTGVGLFGNFVSATFTHQVAAFLAAISFPVLSMYYVTDMLDDIDDVPPLQILANCAISLLLAVFFSLCGACLLAAILTDTRFLLEIDFYRGVKLTFLLPLLFILIICLKKYDILGYRNCVSSGDYWHQTKVLLRKCFTLKNMLLIVAGLVLAGTVLYVFVGRTGHAWQLPVPQIELNMRYWLEEHLYARPRAKEFLIGHVAFCLLVLACHRAWPRFWKLCFIIGATVGQVSLVETFCHMRSPFLMSMARAAGGYVFGVVIGVLLVTVLIEIGKFADGLKNEE